MAADLRKFVVTRQHQWATGDLVVEIAQGGRDYSNPDALVKKYPGEFDEHIGKLEAVKVAIAILRAWQADEPKKKILIGEGFTHGDTMPFEGERLTKKLEKAMLKAAQEFDDKLPKCGRCGELLGGKGERYGNEHTMHMGGDESYPFCSTNCAENDYEEQERELAKAMADEEE